MYAIMGATGHTGSAIAERLLAEGQKVRAIGHTPQRLARLTSRGAEPFLADATDANALTRAFTGNNAVYVLVPPNISAPDVRAYQDRVIDAVATALEKSQVGYAVVLSSIGADKPDKTGPVLGLRKLEERLREISTLQALFLRAGYFMENLMSQVGVIGSQNMLAGPVRDDLPLDMIATQDIGKIAALSLSRLDFRGKSSRELHGMRDVTYVEIAKMIGDAIGKPDLKYRQVPGLMLKPILVSMGFSGDMASQLLQMADALNSGYMKAIEARTPRTTGNTTIETFVSEVFVPAYRAQAAAASGGAARA